MTTIMALDHASPRPLRKLHPFIKTIPKQKHHQHQLATAGGYNTPPDSPILPGRKLKL